eukprot:3175599-Amphidinium_carterae.2
MLVPAKAAFLKLAVVTVGGAGNFTTHFACGGSSAPLSSFGSAVLQSGLLCRDAENRRMRHELMALKRSSRGSVGSLSSLGTVIAPGTAS